MPLSKDGPSGNLSIQRYGRKSTEHTIIERKNIRITEVEHPGRSLPGGRCTIGSGGGGSEFIRG